MEIIDRNVPFDIGKSIENCFITEGGMGYVNAVDGLYAIASALRAIAKELSSLDHYIAMGMREGRKD